MNLHGNSAEITHHNIFFSRFIWHLAGIVVYLFVCVCVFPLEFVGDSNMILKERNEYLELCNRVRAHTSTYTHTWTRTDKKIPIQRVKECVKRNRGTRVS